jgi:hypothetical protein
MAHSPSGSRLGAAGQSRLGCVVRLAILAAAIYYGFHLTEPYVRYLRIKDTIAQAAAFAVNLSDEEIRRRIVEDVRRLGLPKEAEQVHIQRQKGERIVIWIEYTETVQLPGLRREVRFRPRAERGLWRL